MSTRDELTKLCDKLENCRNNEHCYKNEIVCTKKILKDYINNDINKVLQLKALIKYHDENNMNFIDFITKIIAVCSFVLVILHNLSNGTDSHIYVYGGVAIIYVIIIVILSLIGFFTGKNTRPREKWRRFMAVVLDELEKEIRK